MPGITGYYSPSVTPESWLIRDRGAMSWNPNTHTWDSGPPESSGATTNPPNPGGTSAYLDALNRYGIDPSIYGAPLGSGDVGLVRNPSGALTLPGGLSPGTPGSTTAPGTPTTTPSPNANQINLGDLSSFFQNFLQQGQQQQNPQGGLDLSGLGQYRSQLPYYSPG